MCHIELSNYVKKVRDSFTENSKFILNQINLKINYGDKVAIVGPSGAGKTTLLQAMVFSDPPSTGKILVNGKNPWAMSRSKRHGLRKQFFFVPQENPFPNRQSVYHAALGGLLPSMNALDSFINLFYPRHLNDISNVLSKFYIEDRVFERVDKLSGGEKRRISLSRAILSKASFWALDEPLSGLDTGLARDVMNILLQTSTDRSLTFVCSLHQVDIALGYFSRIIGIKEASIVFDLAPEQVTDETMRKVYER